MTSIVIAADDSYLPYVPCNFAQLARFGHQSDSVALVVPATTGKDQRDRIETAAVAHGINLELVPVSELDNLYWSGIIRDYGYVSRHTYSKLLLSDLLPDLDDVLYLDVDTLIRAPLDELLDWELHHPLGAVTELSPGGLHLFGTPRQPYFNAGVLRMSLERMRREHFAERAREVLSEHVFTLQDQDVFNLLFMDRFDCLPLTFNVFDNLTQANRSLAALQDPAIVHFAGPRKPWHTTYKTPYAREWRRVYSQAALSLSPNPSNAIALAGDSEMASRRAYAQSRRAGRSRLGSATRAILPEVVREATRSAGSDMLDRALHRIEEMKSALVPPPAHLPSWGVPSRASSAHIGGGAGVDRLDLLISLPGSGANTLGEALEHARSDLHWLSELYGGASRLGEPGLSGRFPWFASGDPEARRTMSRSHRFEARRDFAATMSKNVVEFTQAVMESREGRILIEIFPDQLHPLALGELLEAFRPRLVFMRRDILFPYLAQARANCEDPHRPFEPTDPADALNEKTAVHFAIRCDSWIDGVAGLAQSLGLQSLWLTYDGVFTTGDDIPPLGAFYPGGVLPTDTQSRGLRSTRRSPADRGDAAILTMIKALSTFSAHTQAQLLRLPGNHVEPSRGVQVRQRSRTRDGFPV